MLTTFGAKSVHLLDGGLNGWIEAGLPTESTPVTRPPAVFRATLNAEAVVDYGQLKRLLAGNAQVLDARSASRFAGAAPEPRAGLSSGHMPGAISVPFTELVESGRLKSPHELAALFVEKKVDLSRPITTSCGSGVAAV
jgi:thiosulfate/3-mercaptopyruvate sulfurtransferase